MDSITFRLSTFLQDMVKADARHVHLVMIATKPDIIKQVPLYKELKARGHLVLLGHTGQHYDENLSGGMLKEFGVEPDFNLNVRGSMHEVVSQIIGRLGVVIGQLKDAGKIVIPYVHGDTTTAMAAGNAGYCHGFASVHVEAGIRTLTPRKQLLEHAWKSSPDEATVARLREQLRDRGQWDKGSQEPYPEQFNTRCSEAATGVHLAPVELDKQFLHDEGFAWDRIFVVGNSVADATQDALRRIAGSKQQAAVFEKYPLLATGDFVRFCIHRRENCLSQERFMAIMNAMGSLLEGGRTVLLISLFQTESAIDRFGMRETVEGWKKRYAHFVYSPVWAEYVDVIAAMSKAAVCATDSGSMQEEMNVLGVPCVTLRFGSDRSESIMNGGNLLAPPVSAPFIAKSIDFAWNRQDMRQAPKLYGENVSVKCVDAVEEVLRQGEVFRTEDGRLGIMS